MQDNVLSAAATSLPAVAPAGEFASHVFQYGGVAQENAPSAAATSMPAVAPAGRKRKKVKVVPSPSLQARILREKSWPDYGYL